MKRKAGLLACLVLAAVLLAPVGAFFSAVFIGPIRNDRAAEQLRRELLESVELLPGETLVDSACFAGNTSGTGNYVRLWAGMLTYYDGPAEDAPSWRTLAAPGNWRVPGTLTFWRCSPRWRSWRATTATTCMIGTAKRLPSGTFAVRKDCAEICAV